MPAQLSPIDRAKYAAARRAVEFVEDGMKLGLGTGSTAAWMVRCLAGLVEDGLQITGVPTSARTAELARQAGIRVITLEEARWLDLTIDGADELDPGLSLIKGGGGALLREKIVATASDRMIVIADPTKSVGRLGAFPLPVEVIPFGWQATRALLAELLETVEVAGREIVRREAGGEPFRTDEGNFILDLHLGRIGNPRQLGLLLNQIAGVVENGLFVDICDLAVTGHGDGRVEVFDLATGQREESRIDLGAEPNIFADL